MKKIITLMFLSMFFNVANAQVVGISNNKIEQITVYDDYEGGLIRIELSNSHSNCPIGGFLNPSSPGFQQLYSLAMLAASMQKEIIVQLYTETNRMKASLCEIDAIRLNF